MDIHPVTPERWIDFEALFESRGGPKNCWCMVWRGVGGETRKTDKASRKKFMRKRIVKSIPVGLLAYSGGEPVAWCSIAPRDTYRPLSGDETIENVWSLVCFYVKREFRNEGLSELLLKEAIAFAKKHRAEYVEAYPVAPDSPSYRFMGFIPMFERHGFKFVKKAGKRRNVMILKLN